MTTPYTPEQKDIIERNTYRRTPMEEYQHHRSTLIDAAALVAGLMLLLWWIK